ncbi:hypothetical protein [Streptomyces fagopyri]|uniref:hypothetical protein n=1 Tax=Streptomyces fagopyri TaxID=2662397 RepID=UPI003801F38D
MQPGLQGASHSGRFRGAMAGDPVHRRRGAGIFVAEGAGDLFGRLLSRFRPTSMEDVLVLLDYRLVTESETARRAWARRAALG